MAHLQGRKLQQADGLLELRGQGELLMQLELEALLHGKSDNIDKSDNIGVMARRRQGAE